MQKPWERGHAILPVAALAMLACTTGAQSPSAPPQGGAVVATKMIGTLEARLSVPGRVKRAETITLSVDLVNRGDTAAKLDAPGGEYAPPFDVLVVGASGDTVWRDPPDGVRQPVLRIDDPIAPGDSQPYGTARWGQTSLRGGKVTPGVYRVSVVIFGPAPFQFTPVGPVPVTITP